MRGNSTLVTAVASIAACSSPALAIRVSDVDMTGVRIRNGFSLSRVRAGIQLAEAHVYSSHTTGMVVGVGGALGAAFPNPTPIEVVMDALSPGAGARLSALGGNPSGGVGATVPPFVATGNPVISGLSVDFSMQMSRTVDASGRAGILISGVVLQPSAETGFLEFVSGTTRFVARCAGDATGDDSVSFADLNVTLAQFGQSTAAGQPLLPGDVNGDGVVNFGDLNLILSRFGITCPE